MGPGAVHPAAAPYHSWPSASGPCMLCHQSGSCLGAWWCCQLLALLLVLLLRLLCDAAGAGCHVRLRAPPLLPAMQGEWLYMIESDYVFMKPLPLPDSQSQASKPYCRVCA